MQDIEFLLTKKQAVAIGERPMEAAILVGSIQRHTHPQKPDYFFRGRWVSGPQDERLRRAAKKMPAKRKSPKTR